MKKSFTENPALGQAITEFVLCACILAASLGGALFLGGFGLQGIQAQIRARNLAMEGAPGWNNARFHSYVYESAELIRFVLNYEKKVNPAGLRFGQITARAEAVRGRRKSAAVMALDRAEAPLAAETGGAAAGMKHILGTDLFGPGYGEFQPQGAMNEGVDKGRFSTQPPDGRLR